MDQEIEEHAVYTTEEARGLLKVSESTIKRLLKRGLLKANKVGGQYRILGKEILKMISPELEQKSVDQYQKVKKKAIDAIKDWPT
jgi:excisionase family DNA binding protein